MDAKAGSGENYQRNSITKGQLRISNYELAITNGQLRMSNDGRSMIEMLRISSILLRSLERSTALC
jgi:hypothetical protein